MEFGISKKQKLAKKKLENVKNWKEISGFRINFPTTSLSDMWLHASSHVASIPEIFKVSEARDRPMEPVSKPKIKERMNM